MPRLFTGITIPKLTSDILRLKQGGLRGARWIELNSFHVTLRFIGDVDLPTAERVQLALHRREPSKPFDVTLDRLGVFGSTRPRMMWAGIRETEALTQLHNTHTQILREQGIEPDGRKYVPHITLARLSGTSSRDVAKHIERAGAFEPLSFQVTDFALYSARSSIGGGPYVVEELYPLGEGAGSTSAI